MEDNKAPSPSAGQGTPASQEGKVSYSQAVSRVTSDPFFRKIVSTIGIVETIHRTPASAYARITIGRGKELSIKVTNDMVNKLRPGTYLQITDSKTEGELQPSIYGIHYGPVHPDHPLCQGQTIEKVPEGPGQKIQSYARPDHLFHP